MHNGCFLLRIRVAHNFNIFAHCEYEFCSTCAHGVSYIYTILCSNFVETKLTFSPPPFGQIPEYATVPPRIFINFYLFLRCNLNIKGHLFIKNYLFKLHHLTFLNCQNLSKKYEIEFEKKYFNHFQMEL